MLMSSWFAPKDRRRVVGGEACDRCGARACVRVVLASGKEIYLCRHHARTHEHALKQLRSTFQELPT